MLHSSSTPPHSVLWRTASVETMDSVHSCDERDSLDVLERQESPTASALPLGGRGQGASTSSFSFEFHDALSLPSLSRNSTFVDALSEADVQRGWPRAPTRLGPRDDRPRKQLVTLAAAVLTLSSGGYSLAWSGARLADVPVASMVLALWLACLVSPSGQPRLFQIVVLCGSLSATLGRLIAKKLFNWGMLDAMGLAEVAAELTWLGVSVSTILPLHLLYGFDDALHRECGVHCVCAGLALSALLGGYVAGQHHMNFPCDVSALPEDWLFFGSGPLCSAASRMLQRCLTPHTLSFVQAVGAFLLQAPVQGSVCPSIRPRPSSLSLGINAAASTSHFWALVGISIGLTFPGHFLYELEGDLLRHAYIMVIAPLLWSGLASTMRWTGPLVLRLLCIILGLGIPVLMLREGKVGAPCVIGRVVLWHAFIAAAAMVANTISFCFGSAHWRAILLVVLVVVAVVDHGLSKLRSEQWGCSVLGPFIAVALSSQLPAPRTKMSAWPVSVASVHGLKARALSAASSMGDFLAERHTEQVQEVAAREAAAPMLSLFTLQMQQLASKASKFERIDPTVFNWAIAEVWTHVRTCLEEDILKAEIEPLLHREVTTMLHFDRVSLGPEPPTIRALQVIAPCSEADCLTLALDVEYDGREIDFAVRCALGPVGHIEVSVTSLRLRGTVFFAFRHRMPHLPIVQGVTIFFANQPDIDLQLSSPSGATSLLPEKAMAQLTELLGNLITQSVVLPNTVPISFDRLSPLWRLKHSRPEGLLIGKAVGAKHVPLGAKGGDVYCRLQLGAQIWLSKAIECADDGGVVWNESAVLFVDHRVSQEVVLSIHSVQTFGDEMVSRRRRLVISDLLRRSNKDTEPCWSLQSSQGASFQTLFGARWHSLSTTAPFEAEWGSVLLVTVEGVRHLPAYYDTKTLVVRAKLVKTGTDEVPDSLSGLRESTPMHQSYPIRASTVSPEEAARNVLRRLRDRAAVWLSAGLGASAIEDGLEGNTLSAASLAAAAVDAPRLHQVPPPPLPGFMGVPEDRWQDRIQYMWRHFRTADGRTLSDWASQDPDGCVHVLSAILGVGMSEEPAIASFVQEVKKAQLNGIEGFANRMGRWKDRRQQPRSGQSQSGLERTVECHWYHQLRLVVPWPKSVDVVVEVAQLKRRDVCVVGCWRHSLRSLLRQPEMVDPLRSRPLTLTAPTPGASASSASSGTNSGGGQEGPVLFAQLELLNVSGPEQS